MDGLVVMMSLAQRIARTAVAKVETAIKTGAFDDAIESAVINAVRDVRNDVKLTQDGFALKIAVAIFDASSPPILFQEAKRLSSQAFHEFLRGNKIRFGDPAWDWSGNGAKAIAEQYVIDFFEPTP